MTTMFEMSLTFEDMRLIKAIVNQGIDSRLEAFTKSSFTWNTNSTVLRLECLIHQDEMTTLLRRLLEFGTDNSEALANEIVWVEYGHETI